MKCIALAEIMPAACEDAQPVSYDRSEDDAGHAHVLCQYDREKDVSAYLENITDVIAELISVTIYHLFKIEDQDSEECIYRTEAVILKRMLKDFPLDTVYPEISIPHEEYRNSGDQSYGNTNYQSLSIDLIGTFLSHRTDLTCKDYPDTCGYKVSEKSYDARYRCYRIDRGDTCSTDKIAGNDAVAKEHDIHDGLRESA